jgi:hypothetical protein
LFDLDVNGHFGPSTLSIYETLFNRPTRASIQAEATTEQIRVKVAAEMGKRTGYELLTSIVALHEHNQFFDLSLGSWLLISSQSSRWVRCQIER